MLRLPVTKVAVNARLFSSSASSRTKVTVLGAGGGIGQPLSLLLKNEPLVTKLALYDIRGAPGVAADVSHVDTSSEVTGYAAENLTAALEGADIVVIPAGVPRKPGMSRDDLFNTNASIVRDLAKAISKTAPNAFTLIISNPVNSTVPIVAEVFRAAGTFNPKRLFGITTLDVVRASRFTSSLVPGSKAETTVVPVVGGHSGVTIVPLLSQSTVGKNIKSGSEEWKALVHRIQFGGDEVVKAKDGAGSATLSMAYAAAKFSNLLLRAVNGEKGLVTPTFVESAVYKSQGVSWFSSNVELGKEGVEKIHEIGAVTPEEKALIEACLPELAKNISKGENFVKQ